MSRPSGFRTHRWTVYVSEAEFALLEALRADGDEAGPLSRADMLQDMALHLGQRYLEEGVFGDVDRLDSYMLAVRREGRQADQYDTSRGGRPPSPNTRGRATP